MRNPFVQSNLSAIIFAITLCLLIPADLHATSGCGGREGGSEGTGGGSFGSPGPSFSPWPGLEGMPTWGAPGSGNNPFDNMGPTTPTAKKPKKTPQQKKWEDVLLDRLKKHLKDKIKGAIEDALTPDIDLALPPPLLGAKKAYDGIKGAYDTTKEICETLEETRKAFQAPYEKAYQGMSGSGMTGSGPDGTANDEPGDMSPNTPMFDPSGGGGGPQAPNDSNFMM